MADISFDFRNMIGSKKCAVSPPRIVSLEIRDESPDAACKSAFEGFFRNNLTSGNSIKSDNNLIGGSDKQNDNSFLIHSESSLSGSTSDNRPYGTVSSINDSDIDVNLLELLNSSNTEKSCVVNFDSKKNISEGKIKIIPNFEVSDGLSDLLSSISSDIAEKGEINAAVNCQRKKTQNRDVFSPDIDFAANNCADSLLGKSSKSCVKVEGNLSDLLSSIDIENCNVDKVGSFKSSNNYNTKNEPCLADFSDILSSIHHKASDVNKTSNSNLNNMHHAKSIETEKEPCLADLLSSINIQKPVSNSIPLNTGSSKSFLKNTDGTTDLLNDLAFDIVSCSSNSCASSFSETENNSPKGYLANNDLADKGFDSDSGFSSFDSAQKEFSFFDYSSDNQMSFDKLLANKSDASACLKKNDSEHAKSTIKEMSMFDLMTIVSPEFKNPILSTLNKPENKDSSCMLDLFESLNSEPKNSDAFHINSNSVKCDEKLRNFVCVEKDISNNVQSDKEANVINPGFPVGNQAENAKSVITVDEDKLASDDEQTTFIDLRECIKSSTDLYTPASPIKQLKNSDDESVGYCSPNKNPFYTEDNLLSDVSQNKPSSFDFNDTVPRKKSRINSKQTLFSKALSCKPKKDSFLLQKVASIKNEILNTIINRPVYIDCDVPQPIIEPVQQSNKCILSYAGRRTFGLDAPCEMQ